MRIAFAVGLVAGLVLPAAAPAQEARTGEAVTDEQVTQSNWMPPSQVLQRLSELGYTDIEELEVEGDHYEVEADLPGTDGQEVELTVDPTSGKVIEIQEDDWW